MDTEFASNQAVLKENAEEVRNDGIVEGEMMKGCTNADHKGEGKNEDKELAGVLRVNNGHEYISRPKRKYVHEEHVEKKIAQEMSVDCLEKFTFQPDVQEYFTSVFGEGISVLHRRFPVFCIYTCIYIYTYILLLIVVNLD